jgi:hypothetical protein
MSGVDEYFKPSFTSDAARIAILEANYAEGVKRELLPAAQRQRMDRECMNVTPAHIAKLRKAAGLA